MDSLINMGGSGPFYKLGLKAFPNFQLFLDKLKNKAKKSGDSGRGR